MKKMLVLSVAVMLLLSACAPNFGEEEELVQETDSDTKKKAIIPKYNISDQYYKMVLPFEAGQARGLVADNLNTRLDIDEFETGLMRIAQDTFSTEEYGFKEGQVLDAETIRSWLSRKKEGAALEEAKEKDKEFKNLGLNPPTSNAETAKAQSEESPIYLAHILEHNYFKRKNEETVEFGGVVLGLALNSVYYYNQEDGYPRQRPISDSEIRAEGEKIAAEVVKRVRAKKGMENIPIVIAMYKQAPKSSIVPGNFLTKAEVKPGQTNIGDWKNLNEEHHFFPSPEATKAYRDDASTFDRFKNEIDEFFPNYTGVIGKGFYKDGELQELKIEIPMQFYGKTEVIAFTQFVTGKIMEFFPDYLNIEVDIHSTGGPEALIVRKPNQEKPTVHIFE
ncbi:CamS family sex pheromone protein [Metabacillus arenae]|uniref:CamS family sex pheromone protein n=1 Tax=Metabacillus arenae TaxID=2771434 RepID=A0A926NKP6_9BACI|nr:CamS family sex pheromone protein [Metabacillus arenae]MBD1382378.1 CamS family sex pheromone protein [Metabacillus arenae]